MKRGSSYSQGPARGGRYSQRETTAVDSESTREVWFRVYKNGAQLSYGHDFEKALKNAARCGGIVKAWQKGNLIGSWKPKAVKS